MDSEAISIRERLEIDTPFSLMVIDLVGESFYEGFINTLGLPNSLGVVSGLEVVFHPQHGADSVRKPGDRLLFVMSQHRRQSAAHIHAVLQELAGDSRNRGSPERYEASRLRESDGDYQQELVSTRRLR